jgi:protein required for attachment to host cells
MKTTWILAAESARARIFSVSGRGGKLREVEDFSHPQARLHDRELTSDLPGRSFDSLGQGRHGMEPTTSPHEHEAQIFATEIARHLDRARHEGSFDALIIVAPPKFLGRLRPQLSKPVQDALVGEIDKNLVDADGETIAEQVSSLLP